MRLTIEEYLEQYPSIQMVLDIHRDAAEDADGNPVALTAEVNGADCAALMLVVGTDEGGLSHPDWQENLSAALKLQALLNRSDFVILSGGHVPTQNAFFQKIHLPQLLQDFEGTVMGISAGSMNCAEWVYVQPEEPGESSPDFPRFAPGLGLTEVNILPHYQQVKDNILDGLQLFEDITYPDSQDNCFFALPDNSYIYQDPEHLLLFGEGYCLCDGVMEQISENDQVLDLA